jgi:hypothetical protein
MKTTVNILIAIVFVLGIASLVWMVVNPRGYCKLAMFGQINSVPAMCIKYAIEDLN